MPRMTDEALLKHLQAHEDDASQYVESLGAGRLQSLREYRREPYGNEQEGWSQIVTSEVQDTVEWILPDLLSLFISNDEAVCFEPTRAEDVEGSKQATDTCNYVFYKRNDGFLTLYTAFKDALLSENCALMWRKETVQERRTEQVQGVTPEILAMIREQDGMEIEAATERQVPVPVPGPDGQPMLDPNTQQPVMQPVTVYDVNLARTEEKTTIKVEAFPPEQLLIRKGWTSPVLRDCPYVCRVMEVTLSDLRQMGFKVEASELRASREPAATAPEDDYRRERYGVDTIADGDDLSQEDDSQATGWLRIEYVLVDSDGDGVAERRCIFRLATRILSDEECSHVQIATASPILNTHRWNGMSVASLMSDLQKLKTDLTRALVNSANLAADPRKVVLTDNNGAPVVDIDDLLDFRIGGIIRTKNMQGLGIEPQPFTGQQMLPVLEYIDVQGEKRTGVSKMQQGIDPNALRTDRTAYEAGQLANAAKQRVALIGRIFGETLLKPAFLGIFKLLTDGDMQPIAMRLRGEFVQYDPNEWRDQYDMTVNVGLGSDDNMQKAAQLQAVGQMQMGLLTGPMGAVGMVTPQHIYNTSAEWVRKQGFKNVGDFIADPEGKPMPPPPPPPQLAMEQQKLQYQAEKDRMDRDMQAQVEMIRQQAQQQTDASRQALEAQMGQMRLQHEAQLQALKAQYDDARHQREMEFQRWKAELDASVRIEAANISSKAKIDNPATQTATAEISREVQP